MRSQPHHDQTPCIPPAGGPPMTDHVNGYSECSWSRTIEDAPKEVAR